MIDLIIVNFNSTEYLLRCLESIYASIEDLPVNVIVQDNNSNDNPERAKSAFPNIIFKKNKQNLGFSVAVNKALGQTFAPFIVLLNPDTIVEKGFLSTILDYMIKYPKIGIIGPQIYDYDGRIQGSARSFPTPLTFLFGRNSPLTKLYPRNPITEKNILAVNSDGKTPMPVDWVSGACMIVRREAIKDVGPLDERFFVYWEDADWCKRMWDKGWRVVYFPLASIVHFVGGSSARRPVRPIFEFHISCYKFLIKYRRYLKIISPCIVSFLALRAIVTVLTNKIVLHSKKVG